MSDEQSEFVMRFRGEKGDQGDKGDRGEGITKGARRAVLYLIMLNLLLVTLSLVGTAHYVNSSVHASQKATEAKAAAAIAAQKAAATQAALEAACRAANTSRAEQVDLWTFILRITRHPRTAPQQHVITEFEHHLHFVFAPRSCALPRPRPGPP